MHPSLVEPMTMVYIEDQGPENRKRGDPWSGGLQHCKRRRLDPSEFLVDGNEQDCDHKDHSRRWINNKSTTSKALVPSRKRLANEPLQHWSPKHISWMMENLPKQQVAKQTLSTSRAMVVWKPPSTPVNIGRLPSLVGADGDSENEDDTIIHLESTESSDTVDDDDDMMDISDDLV